MSLLDDIKDLPPSRWAGNRKWGGMHLASHHIKTVQNLARQARSFIFDAEASRKLAHFVKTCPDLLVDNVDFAVLPYETTYIELDLEAFIEGLGRLSTRDIMGLENADWKAGWLAHGNFVYELCNSHENQHAYVSPFGIIDLKNEKVTGSALDNGFEEHTIIRLLGTSYSDLTEKQRHTFARHYGIAYFGLDNLKETYKQTLNHGNGLTRTYVAALLMLYQKQHITIKDQPFERKISRGKMRTYMSHSTVTIHLENDKEVRRAFSISDRQTPRRHEVRTHYAHKWGTKACEHKWDNDVDKPTHWACKKCGRFRWLVKEHLRGSAAIGFVTKHYEVKK